MPGYTKINSQSLQPKPLRQGWRLENCAGGWRDSKIRTSPHASPEVPFLGLCCSCHCHQETPRLPLNVHSPSVWKARCVWPFREHALPALGQKHPSLFSWPPRTLEDDVLMSRNLSWPSEWDRAFPPLACYSTDCPVFAIYLLPLDCRLRGAQHYTSPLSPCHHVIPSA